MAINFLQNVSLNNTELQNFKVQNITGTLPSGLAGEGQLIYKTDTNELYLHKGSNAWVDLAAGTVSSVGISSNYFTVGSSPITSSGTISVDMPNSGVTANTYTHATITVNAQGVVTSAASGTATLGVTSFTNANGTFVSASTTNSGATGAVTMGTIDLSATGSPSATTFLRGDNVWATPAGAYTSWSLEGDSGSAVDITDGLRVDFTGGTGISTAVASATPNTLTITNTGVTSAVAGSNISVSSATGAVTIAYTGGTGEMTSWNLAGDSGSQSITNANTATFIGGTGISTAASATDDLTITLDDTAVSPGSYTLASITVDQQGRITSASSGSSGSMSNWKIGSTSGTDQTVSNGQTVDVVGGLKISGTVGGTRTVTLAHDTQSQTNTTPSSTLTSGGTFKAISSNIGVDSTGHVLGQELETYTLPTSDNYGSWTLAGDSGSNQTISSGNTATYTGGSGISTEAGTSTDELTITNTGVLSNAGGTGISVSGSTGAVTITNTGVTSVSAGTGISVSGSPGGVTITNTSTNTDANYALSVGAVSSNESTLSLVGSSGGSTTTAKFSGTTSEIEITTPSTGNGGDITIGLPNSVTVQSSLVVGSGGIDTTGVISVGGTGQSSFAGQVTVPATPSASTDAASKGYVLSQVAGVGSFQGGYNADTNSPALTGGSNVALTQGDFFAVTVAGSFFTDSLEPGDLIFANSDITASSSPSLSDYTVVIADENIAGAGATDGVTEKGVAGFDSANFGVTANGFVTIDNSGVSAGSYGGVTKSLNATVDAKGFVTAMSENTIAIPASQITDFCSAVANCINTNYNFKTTITGTSPYTVNHNLGTRDVMVYVYDNASPYEQTFVEVVHTDTDNVTISTAANLGSDVLKVLVVEVL